MAYVPFPINDLGSGIDALSSEAQIPEGFSERLVNVDPTPEGYLSKRAGYSSKAGWLPVRVKKIDGVAGSPDQHCFYLDSGVDVTTVDLTTSRSTPLVVYGRLGSDPGVGDFSDIDTIQYYSGFSAETRSVFTTGTSTNTLLGTEHGKGTLLLLGTAQSDNQVTNDNTIIWPDVWSVDKTTADVSVTYTNNTGSSFEGFIYVTSGAPVAGTTYVDVTVGPTTTISVPAATHQLSNTNILTAFYQDTGAAYVQVWPDVVDINSTGDVVVTFSSAQTNLVSVLKAAPLLNTVQDTVAPGQTFSKSFTVEQSFLITSAYEENLITGAKASAYPDSISVEDGIATVTYTNLSSTALNFLLYFEYGSLATNKLCVTANSQDIASSFTTENVQLSIWGLSHAEIYSSQIADQHPGWVTHIDNYRVEGVEKLVSGLGGNLFSDSGAVLPAALHPRLRSRVGATTDIGPAFADSSTRTRGFISFDGATEGYAKGISVAWDAGAQLMLYTLDMPNIVLTGAINTIVKSTLNGSAGQEDWLEITQSAVPENSGTFRIADVAVGTDQLLIWIDNENAGSSDFDESDSGMLTGIFTDTILLLGVNPFLPGDILSSDLFTDSIILTVLDATPTAITFSGVDSLLSVPIGLRIAGARTSRVIPLRTAGDSPSVSGLVRGDVLTYEPIERLLQITRINTLPDTSVSITGNGIRATVTLSIGETVALAVGQSIVINYADVYTGTQEIELILSPTEFTFLSEETASTSGTLVGNTVEVNELLPFSDSQANANPFAVPSRWVPIEAPDDAFDLTPNTHISYLNSSTYVNQPILRSTMSNDTMFFTSGQDEVLKYDGTSIYRAGLPTWQMQLFSVVDTGISSIQIAIPTITTAQVTAYASSVYTVTLGTELNFSPGDLVSVAVSGVAVQGTVSKVWSNATTGFVQIASSAKLAFTGAATSITLVGRFRYYFRLNAIDANDNIVASTVVGSSDFIVDVEADCQIRLSLVGLAPFGTYDFDRIEAEVYRTRLGTVAPFYRLATIPMSFNLNEGYINFTDTFTDDTLVDLDAVSTALEGAELGSGWSEPLRAKYITSSANRLVLGNIKDYSKLTLRFVDKGLSITPANLNGKRFLFRKDSDDTTTITTNTDSVAFQFTTASTAVTPVYSGSGIFTFTGGGPYVAGDWVYLFRGTASPSLSLNLAGWYQVVTGGAGSFTIQTALTALPAVNVDRVAIVTDRRDVPVYLGVDFNYAQKDFNNTTSIYAILNAMRRWSSAVNATQRVCRTTGFTPWLSAQAGAEFAIGEIVFSQPLVLDTTTEILLPAFNTDFLIFVNGVKRADSAAVSTLTQLFPSRVTVSYPNFPELFNRPTSPGGTVSQVYDINPADGQEITGVIPFFGESVFGASAKGSIVVVFKTNSIYLLDLSGNSIDGSRIQKVDSRGIGCTAPFSIAPTQDGVMFATDSGIYRLKQNLTVEYNGRKLERIWQQETQSSAVGRAIMTGHYFPLGNCYKLSVPFVTETTNDSVFVYNTVREYSPEGYRPGSWTIYDNHPAVGWANSTSSAFFGSTKGDVLEISSSRSEKPFRDSGAAINATATLRALDFGDPSIRKSVGIAVIAYRASEELDNGTRVFSSIDLKDQFVESDIARVSNLDTPADGLGATGTVKVRPIRYSFDRRKGVYFQLQITNSLLDSPMDVTSISLRVAGLSSGGIVSAIDSK